jgi:cysteine desulfurase/selenocysteine lyase
MVLDIAAIRADFPILAREVAGGKKLVYLDNAATTQKPRQVIDAMSHFYENCNSNVHRAVHTLAVEATEQYEAARDSIADWFGAKRENMIFTAGTTEAINLVAWGWARENLGEGDVILLTEMEHHADIVPWQLLGEEKGIEIRYIPINTEDGTLDMDAFDATIEEVSLVCVVHTSNVLGTRNPIERIISDAHARGRGGAGAKVLIDCAQGAPHHSINFATLGAEFVAISGHKMCGPTGIGCLLVDEDTLTEMVPFISGGDMIEEVHLTHSTFQTGTQKFEAGTPKIAEAIGWGAAINWLSQFDMTEIHAHCRGLGRWTAEQIRGIEGMTVHGEHDSDSGSGVVSFLHDSLHSEDLARLMDAGGFAMRTGHHCAQPLLRAFGVTSSNRVSFYLYNTREEAEAFIEHLRDVVTRFS